MLSEEYFNSFASIDFQKIRILQLRDDASFYKMDVCQTMTSLRDNPHDMGYTPKEIENTIEYYDMIVIWVGANGLLIVSANDKRFPYVPREEFDGNVTMTYLKKDKCFLSILERKACAKQTPLSNGAVLKIWKNPLAIRAITDYDKNYGDRWYWSHGKLLYVEEGNKYGDTSLFFMFGIIEDRLNRFRKLLK